MFKVETEAFSPWAKEKISANKWSGVRLFRLDEVKFFYTFELFVQGLPLPPTQETNTETGLFKQWLQGLKANQVKRRRKRGLKEMKDEKSQAVSEGRSCGRSW